MPGGLADEPVENVIAIGVAAGLSEPPREVVGIRDAAELVEVAALRGRNP